MFGNQLKRWAVLGLAAAAWMAADTFSASAQINMMTSRRNLDRAMMWNGFANNGVSSSAFPSKGNRGMWMLSWPGSTANACTGDAGPAVDWYWQVKVTGHCGQYEGTFISVSEGLISLTQVGGEKFSSFTGPRKTTPEVLPHIYDIENGPEAGWGIDTRSSLSNALAPGTSTANWWPGAPSLLGNDPATQHPYEIHNYDYGIYSPLQNTAETIMISEWESNQHGGSNVLTAKRRVLAWSNQDLDDMLVHELVWTNTSNSQITEAYFGKINGLHVNQQGIAFRWLGAGGRHHMGRAGGADDWIDWSEDPGFKGNPNFVGRGWAVQWDGNYAGSPDDDTGDPFRAANCQIVSCLDPGWLNATTRPDGMPGSPDHVGFGALAWRSSGTGAWNAADAAAGYVEPAGMPRWHYWQHTGGNSVEDPADGNGPNADPSRYDAWAAPSHTPPAVEDDGFTDVLWGPYTLDPGDQVKLVLAYVEGTGSHVTINSATGYPVDPLDWTYNIIGSKGQDDAFRNAELAKGHDGLWTNVSHAEFAYSNQWQIPNTPPDVDFAVANSETAQNLVTVPSLAGAVNPDYGSADVDAIRIYASDYAEYGPWILQTTLPATGGSWVDESSVAGFSRFYNVRSVATAKTDWSEGSMTLADLPAQMAAHVTGGMESGYSAPEQRMTRDVVPSQPATAKGDNFEIPIRVVPNPLNIRNDTQSYSGNLKMRFVGIPSQCRISIYSVGGDLVSTLYHRNSASGEADFTLKNRTITSELMTGVYYWVVESLLSGSSGETQSGYLVIHR